jgi:tRNA dimethylallyltransferase
LSSPRGVVLLILGPTASGKSEVASEVARRGGGEIVSGDAFAVYRGFDIGTAKPSLRERREIPHHLIDVAEPDEPFSAGRWSREARRAVEEIDERGRLPVVAGGSHFYLRALLGHLPEGEVVNRPLRDYLAMPRLTREQRKRWIEILDPHYAVKVPLGDTARQSRALEILFTTGRRVSERLPAGPGWASRRRVVKISLQISPPDLYTRIQMRIRTMWDSGWPDEVQALLRRGVPLTANAFRAIGYREVAGYLAGDLSESEAIGQIERRTRSLARRQRTWLASEPDLLEASRESAAELALQACAAAG